MWLTFKVELFHRQSCCNDFLALLHFRSPDTANRSEDSDVLEEPSIWKGEFTMHGMARFSASAYAVSGSVEYLDEVCISSVYCGSI